MDDSLVSLIRDEAERAHARYGPFTSTHEALGVLVEEMHELTEAIRGHAAGPIAREAIQVAAVAARLAGQCLDDECGFPDRSNLWA